MAYSLSCVINLGASYGGMASSLRGQLYDTAGTNVGSEISTGFIEIGTGTGIYNFASTGIVAAHRGGLKVYLTGQATAPLAAVAVNPEDVEDIAIVTAVAPAYKPVVDASGNAAADVKLVKTVDADTAISSRVDASTAATDVGTVASKLPAGGALMHAAGAAVAKSPATLAAGDVSGNLPVDVLSINGSTLAAQVLAARNYAYKDDAVVLVADAASDAARGTALLAAMATARALTPGGIAKAKNNRVSVLVPPGRYDLVTGTTQGGNANTGLLLDTEYVDLRGLTNDLNDAMITSQIAVASRGTVQQTANDVWICGIRMNLNAANAGSGNTRNAAYFPAGNLPLTRLIDCKTGISGTEGGVGMRSVTIYSGTYWNVLNTGDYGFGSGSVASGLFVDCINNGGYGFGASGTASGTFVHCFGMTDTNWPTTPTGRCMDCYRGAPGAQTLLDNTGKGDWVNGGRLDLILDTIAGAEGGVGAEEVVIVCRIAGSPVDGVEVWLTTDLAGDDVSHGPLTSNAFGKVIFYVDGIDPYYVWKQLSGTNFTNPETLVWNAGTEAYELSA